MKPSEELLEISRRRYERAGIIADWKPDPNCVGSQDILEWLDAQASGATVAERDSLPTYHQRARRSEHYRCPVHGSHVLADAGGECAGCGADCFIEPCCGTMQCTGQPSEPAAPQPESSGGGETRDADDEHAANIILALDPDGTRGLGNQYAIAFIAGALQKARELGAKAERERNKHEVAAALKEMAKARGTAMDAECARDTDRLLGYEFADGKEGAFKALYDKCKELEGSLHLDKNALRLAKVENAELKEKLAAAEAEKTELERRCLAFMTAHREAEERASKAEAERDGLRARVALLEPVASAAYEWAEDYEREELSRPVELRLFDAVACNLIKVKP